MYLQLCLIICIIILFILSLINIKNVKHTHTTIKLYFRTFTVLILNSMIIWAISHFNFYQTIGNSFNLIRGVIILNILLFNYINYKNLKHIREVRKELDDLITLANEEEKYLQYIKSERILSLHTTYSITILLLFNVLIVYLFI